MYSYNDKETKLFCRFIDTKWGLLVTRSEDKQVHFSSVGFLRPNLWHGSGGRVRGRGGSGMTGVTHPAPLERWASCCCVIGVYFKLGGGKKPPQMTIILKWLL